MIHRAPSLPALALALGGCALGLAARPAWAQDEGYPPISHAGVRAGAFQVGEKRSITGKYQELVNREIRIYGLEARCVLSQPQLSRQLFEFKAQKDNLTLLGVFRTPAPGPPGAQREDEWPVFEVEKIRGAPADLELFDGRLKALLAARQPGVAELKELAEEVAASITRFAAPELRPIARRAYAEVFAAADRSLPRDDADGRLALIREIHTALAEQELTVELLRGQARRFPEHAATQRFLTELRCMQAGGEWLTYPEFKRKLGFVQRGDRWVKPARKEFLDIIQRLATANPTNLILRARTDREYELLAQNGKVERGMTREELATALGLPDRVDREVRDTSEFDQWNYGDRRVYLLNGQVVTLAH